MGNSWAGWALAAVLVILQDVCSNYVTAERPNMVILLADDIGYGDVEFNNAGRTLAKTPNLNDMAMSGVTFTNMHSEASCTPSRVAILTSRWPLRECVWGVAPANMPLFRVGTPSIAKIARDIGYRTLFLGKFVQTRDSQDNRGWPTAMGFENWTMINHGITYDFPCFCDKASRKSCFLGHVSLKEIETHECFARASPFGEPYMPPRYQMEALHLSDLFTEWIGALDPSENFFVQMSFRSNHKPFVASPELRSACESGKICNDIGRPKTSTELDYAGCVASIDEAVGAVRAALRKYRPLDWQNTIVVFTSDNGPEDAKKGGAGSTMGMRGRKLSLYEGLLRVPAVLEWPSMIRGGLRTNAFTSIMDFSVTFLDIISKLTGFVDTETRDGQSLVPLLLAGGDGDKWAREKPFGVCSCISDEEAVVSKIVCDTFALFDPTGTWKLLSRRANPARSRGQTSKAVPFALFNLDDPITGELSNLLRKDISTTRSMKRQADQWLDNLFGSFRANCAGYF